MKRWMWFETMFSNLRDGLRAFLQESNIEYELAACGKGWHFEILCSAEDEKLVNDWLEQNTITEVRA